VKNFLKSKKNVIRRTPPSVKQLYGSNLFDTCQPPIGRFLPINCIEYAIILYTYRKYYARSKVMRLSQGKIIYLLINRSAVVTTTCAFITKRLAVVTTTCTLITTTYALVTTAGAFITKRLAVVSSSTKLNIKIGLGSLSGVADKRIRKKKYKTSRRSRLQPDTNGQTHLNFPSQTGLICTYTFINQLLLCHIYLDAFALRCNTVLL
jgi:hypothetical protein